MALLFLDSFDPYIPLETSRYTWNQPHVPTIPDLVIAVHLPLHYTIRLYVEWEGNTLYVQVNDNEPHYYKTPKHGFFSTMGNFPTFVVQLTENEPRDLLNVNDAFQIRLIPLTGLDEHVRIG